MLFWQLYNHLWKINQCLLSHLNGPKEVMRSPLSVPVKQGNVGNEILENELVASRNTDQV